MLAQLYESDISDLSDGEDDDNNAELPNQEEAVSSDDETSDDDLEIDPISMRHGIRPFLHPCHENYHKTHFYTFACICSV